MTNATPTGSVCPLRRPPKGKDHPSASRTPFSGLPPDSRNPSSPQPSRLLDSPHHHADVGLADEKSGLVLSLVNCREPSEWCPDRKRSLPTCRRSLAGCAAQIPLASVPRSSAYSEGSRADGSGHLPCAKDPVCASGAPVELVEKRRPGVLPHTDRRPSLPTLHRWLAAHHLASSGPNRGDASRGTVELQLYDRVHCVALGRRHPHLDACLGLLDRGAAARQHAVAHDAAGDRRQGDCFGRPTQDVQVDGVSLVGAAAPPVSLRQREMLLIGRPLLLVGSDEGTAARGVDALAILLQELAHFPQPGRVRLLDQPVRPGAHVKQQVAVAYGAADQPAQAFLDGTQDVVRIVRPLLADGGAGLPWPVVLKRAY